MSTIFVQLGFTKSSVTEIPRRVGQGLGNKEEGRRGRGGVADWRARRLLESELLSFTQPSRMTIRRFYFNQYCQHWWRWSYFISDGEQVPLCQCYSQYDYITGPYRIHFQG
ncbi:hypothetical protein T4D_4260 [Trichinella pseudospiralis]|uniref:Uncharacterized protein n=1 Tax=Trichinella pseudospiralis TaxID=6337 RepID=A0A0V1F5D5_TRIPS|nr:hypothetical protein T4D_8416 [Trichinella pseudospiralis]KRY82012.1 hypothetical protein T4D_6306 [Trichinella pseudospiralis]KRY85908.1 hypothetical protein T4D_4260 [Trichinella pseudospiralis]